MFTWSLILCAWVALLLLIWHDVTKNDSEGSAILIAGNKVVTLVRWAALKTGELFRWAGSRPESCGTLDALGFRRRPYQSHLRT